MDSFQSLVSFPCVLKLYLTSGRPPKEHRCHFSFGHVNNVPCFQVEGMGVQCKRLKFTADNLKSLAISRLHQGRLSISLMDREWQTITITDVKDKQSLNNCSELLNSVKKGTLMSGSLRNVQTTPSRTPPTRNSPMLGSGSLSNSSSSSGRRTLKLFSHPNNWRGAAMVAAAQTTSRDSTGAHTSGFYNTTTPKAEPFLPRLTDVSHRTGYFNKARRNLSVNLEAENDDSEDFKPVTNKLRHAQSPSLFKSTRSPLTDLPARRYGSIFQERIPDNVEGFANLGNTCYMNAVLQSLLGLEPFAEDVLNFKLVKQVHPESLYRMMFFLLKSKRAKDSYESQRILLKKIKQTISTRSIKFLGYRQQDAQEFLGQALDQLKDDTKDVEVSDQESLCPVLRNFECEILHTIACKSCDKVINNSETIYDFALQLPLSVYHQHNEQANLQQLFEGYFTAEEVEYTCTECNAKFAMLSHKLQRLPRVLVLHLKRYGYDVQLSKNSKRVDDIRIPRFINVGELCVEDVSPPCEFKGPWPRDPEALSAMATNNENKENMSNRLTTSSLLQVTPPTTPPSQQSAIPDSTTKPPETSTITISDSPTKDHHVPSSSHVPTTDPVVTLIDSDSSCTASPYVQSHPSEDAPVIIKKHNNTAQPSSAKFTSQQLTTITTEHDVIDLTSPEIVFLNEKSNQTNGSTQPNGRHLVNSEEKITTTKTPVKDRYTNGEEVNQPGSAFKLGKRKSTERDYEACQTQKGKKPAPSGHKLQRTDSDSKCSQPASAPSESQSSVEVDSQRTRRKKVEDEFDTLFSPEVVFDFESKTEQGQISSDQQSTHEVANHAADSEISPGTSLAEQLKLDYIKTNKEQEEAELQKAIEASIKEQPNDLQLLHQLGVSEEEQFRLAMQLSIQDMDTVTEDLPIALPSVSPSGKDENDNSNPSAATAAVTPEQGSLETYKLVSIVSHIGRESGGGHYISDVYTVADRMWKTYNDSQVSETKEELVRQRRQKSGYIFFYMHRSTYNNVAKHFRH